MRRSRESGHEQDLTRQPLTFSTLERHAAPMSLLPVGGKHAHPMGLCYTPGHDDDAHSRLSMGSRTATGSPVSLDERYYQYTESFFSEPIMVLNPKRLDPRNRHKMPGIVICTQEGRTGSPVENWMAPSGAEDAAFLMAPEHECGLTEEEEMQIALDQEQWEREEEERRRDERRRMRAQRRQQRGVTSAAASAAPAKKKKKKGARHADQQYHGGSQHQPQHYHLQCPQQPQQQHQQQQHHHQQQHQHSPVVQSEEVHPTHAREQPPSPPALSLPLSASSSVSQLQFPTATQPVTPSSNYRHCSVIPQTVAELTSPRDTPRDNTVPSAGFSSTAPQPLRADRDTASSACADPAPHLGGTLKRGGSLTSWSVRLQAQHPPSPQQVSAGATVCANATSPPVVSKPVHREIVRMQSPSWAPAPAPPPQLPPTQSTARSIPPSPKSESTAALTVDVTKYIASALALLGTAATSAKLEADARAKEARREVMRRRREDQERAAIASALLGAACGAHTACTRARDTRECERRAAVKDAAARALVAVVGATLSVVADQSAATFRKHRMELKQLFVQKRLMAGRETSARIRMASLEAEERSALVATRDSTVPRRIPSPPPQPETLVPLPLPQTPPRRKACATPTPASATPGTAFRPSLFKADGFSLTFAEMGRLSAASPMGALPLPNSESRLPRPTKVGGRVLRMPFDAPSESSDSGSEDALSDSGSGFGSDDNNDAEAEAAAAPQMSPSPTPCLSVAPDVPSPSPFAAHGVGGGAERKPASHPHAGNPAWRAASDSHSPDEMMEIVSCVEERSVTPPGQLPSGRAPFGETPAAVPALECAAATPNHSPPVELVSKSHAIVVPLEKKPEAKAAPPTPVLAPISRRDSKHFEEARQPQSTVAKQPPPVASPARAEQERRAREKEREQQQQQQKEKEEQKKKEEETEKEESNTAAAVAVAAATPAKASHPKSHEPAATPIRVSAVRPEVVEKAEAEEEGVQDADALTSESSDAVEEAAAPKAATPVVPPLPLAAAKAEQAAAVAGSARRPVTPRPVTPATSRKKGGGGCGGDCSIM